MKKQNIYFALALVAAFAFTACNGNKVQTPKLSSQTDSLNYAFGVANGSDIKNYYLANDSAADKKIATFLRGLEEGLKGSADANPRLTGLGMQFGDWLKEQKKSGFLGDSTLKLDFNLVKQGLINGLKKSTIQMTPQEAQEYLNKTMQARQEKMMQEKYGANKTAGEKFLAENGKKQGVITTPSGLQYEVITKGTGATPKATDRVKVNYHGTLIDGKVFDSSVERKEPVVFGVNQVIPGWTEGLQLMTVGSKYKFYIPQNLAYGAREQQTIPPFSTLIFEVELLSIEK